MFKGLKVVLVIFLTLVIIPFILAWSIEFTYPTDGLFVYRDYILVNVTSSAENTTNITIYLYDANLSIISSNSTSEEQNWWFANFTGLSDGVYYLNATATDNESFSNVTAETRNITIDTIAPDITIVSPNETVYTNDTILVNISVTAFDRDSIWFFNGTGNETYSSPVYRTYAEGNYTIYAYVNDSAGNINSTNITFEISLENNPEVTINSPENDSNISQTYVLLDIIATDLDPEDNMTVWIYGDDILINVTYEQTNGTQIIYNWTGLSDGVHNWTVIANDGTANSTPGYRYFTIDTVAPVIIVHTPSVNVTTNYVDYMIFNITVQDDRLSNTTVSILYYTNWTILNMTTQSEIYIQESGLDDGIYTYVITAYDAAGNSNLSSGTITIDTSIPTVILNSPTDSLYFNNTVALNFSVNSSSNFTCYYILNGQNNSIPDCNSTYAGHLNASETINQFILYMDADSGYSVNQSARFMVGNSSNTLESNSSSLLLNNSNTTKIFVPSNLSLTRVIIESNNSGSENISIYFINITSNSTHNILHLNYALNITRNSTISRYSVELPANLTISGPDNWTGDFRIPTNIPSNSVTITPSSGMTVSVSKTMMLGYASRLNLSRAMKINFTGEYGKIIGYDEGSGTITRISHTCPSADNQTLIDTNLTGQNLECAITQGSDLIVWTKHLSRYVTFTEAVVDDGEEEDGGRSGGGGSGSSGDYVYLPTITLNNGTSNDTDKITFTEYISRQFNGTKQININRQGMPVIYLSLEISTPDNNSNTLDVISQSNNPTAANINARIYRYIRFNTTLNPQNIDNITLKFKISRSWMAQYNLTPDNITIYHLNDTWNSIDSSKYSEDTGYIYYYSEVQSLDAMAIGGYMVLKEIPAPVNNTASVDEETGNAEATVTENEVKVKGKGFLERLGESIIRTYGKIAGYISELATNKDERSLIILAISGLLTIILGTVSGILIYHSYKKSKKEYALKTRYAYRVPSMSKPYIEEPPTEEKIVRTEDIKRAQKVPEPKPTQNTDNYIKKVDQLLTQCEYALDNGKLEEAKKYHAEAREVYFKSNLDYEHKRKVYNRMIELKTKISKNQYP